MILRIPTLVVCIAVAALSLVAASCTSEEKKAAGPPRRPAPVTVATVRSGAIPVRLQAVGNVEAFQTVAVRSQVGGLIVEQRVRDGQEVAAGEVLFLLDQRPFQASLKEAQARLERDQALLKKAEDDLARYTGLRQKDVVSQQQYDQANTDARSLRASIKLSEAAIEQARLQLDYSAIKAPFAGRVGQVLLHVGNVIKANDDRNLAVINQIQPIYASFAVPEQHLPEISARMAREKLTVTAVVGGDEANAETGHLAAVDNAVDRTTGTIRLKALFENASKRLWPGQFAKLTLNLATRENVLTVPATAVQLGLQGSFVYVVTPDNKAEMRPVETGGQVGEGMIIVSKGLAAGETVVADGHVRVAPGALLEIKGGQGQQGAGQASTTGGQSAQGAQGAQGAAMGGQAASAPGQAGEKKP